MPSGNSLVCFIRCSSYQFQSLISQHKAKWIYGQQKSSMTFSRGLKSANAVTQTAKRKDKTISRCERIRADNPPPYWAHFNCIPLVLIRSSLQRKTKTAQPAREPFLPSDVTSASSWFHLFEGSLALALELLQPSSPEANKTGEMDRNYLRGIMNCIYKVVYRLWRKRFVPKWKISQPLKYDCCKH